KAKRRGKILIDYLRNARGAVAVEAYSARARAGATVATPIDWDELSPRLDPAKLNVKSVPKWMRALGRDPWAGYFAVKQSITAEMMKRVGAASA
ncbi:MAG TPA: hypothetical protein VK864_07735, partial [Longimicrobiales bacterium]|nr:hypothetical protein [Longimicrobiales bacterium]